MPSTRPETRYAKSGDLNIAYQVVGDGPVDLIYVPGWISNVESNWEEPAHAHVLERLASFSRLILFDKRGTGLSDPVPLDAMSTLEERMDDVRAVLDAVDCEEAALFGFSEGGLMSVLFAATYPERITMLCSTERLQNGSGAPTTRGRLRPRIARASSRSWIATGRCAWTSTFSHRATTTRSRIASQPISGEAPARAPRSR
jgi:pimeloyl-ACP methyl ester carboxylesterase